MESQKGFLAGAGLKEVVHCIESQLHLEAIQNASVLVQALLAKLIYCLVVTAVVLPP